MLSYYNVIISNAQAERRDLAGYRTAAGAMSETGSNAISHEIATARTKQRRGSTRRFTLLLAATMALAAAGIQDVGAQETEPGLRADVDGIKQPDMGTAYSLPARSSTVLETEFPANDLDVMMMEADGLEPPDIGLAYDTNAASKAYVERQQRTKGIAVRPDGKD